MKNVRLLAFLLLVFSLCAFDAEQGHAQVIGHQKISATEGGFTGTLRKHDEFGVSLDNLGDLDGDGINDLGVGAHQDDDGGEDTGAVWVLFLNADGTVKAHQKISATQGGLVGPLGETAHFGNSVGFLGDLNGDGVNDYAIGAAGDDDVINDAGAVWMLSLNPDGTVQAQTKISGLQGGFTGILDMCDYFGRAVANIGDLDGDGIQDVAVGAYTDDDGGADGDLDANHGAVWILFMNADLTVREHTKISAISGGFTGDLDPVDNLGTEVALLGDIDGDGLIEIAAGAGGDDDGGSNKGAVWILTLNPDGTVNKHSKISDTAGGFQGVLSTTDHFGVSVETVGDLDGDGTPELMVGADFDGDGGSIFGAGAVYILFLNTDGSVREYQKISAVEGGFTGALSEGDRFGIRIANMGDINGDGATDFAVGAIHDDDGAQGSNADLGAVWILFGNQPVIDRPDLDVSLTPLNPPIEIPAEGGSFQYVFSVTNTTDASSTFDIWIDLVGPGVGRSVGPVVRTLAAGETLSQTLTQSIPGGAPAGSYSLTATVGVFPIIHTDTDILLFSKLAASASGTAVNEWFSDFGTLTVSNEAEADVPGGFVLDQNYPNPFNPSTSLRFTLPEASFVRLTIFDMMGREVDRVVDRTLPAGQHEIRWDAGEVPSGTYLYRLSAGSFTQSRSMVLLR